MGPRRPRGVDPREIERDLRAEIDGIVMCDRETAVLYSADASGYEVMPAAIVVPASKSDIALTVRFAGERGIGVTARGGGTGLAGGCLGDGIVIDMKRLDGVEQGDGWVRAGAGAPKGKVDDMLDASGWFLSPNPSVGPYCTIGGMIAANAGGSRGFKYGSMIHNILEVEFIDGLGNVVTLPGNSKTAHDIARIAGDVKKRRFPRVSKNSCGYRLDAVSSTSDSHRIIAGSEGTLGIVVSAKIGLHRIPRERRLYVYEYGSTHAAATDCIRITRAGPAAVEFVKDEGGGCLLLVEIDTGARMDKTPRLAKIAAETSDEKEMKAWWRIRDSSLSRGISGMDGGDPQIIEDAAVPLPKLAGLFKLIEEMQDEFGVRAFVYGHAGDGNLHLRISGNSGTIPAKKMASKYFTGVMRLGGTISAEHGDGLARTPFVRQQYGDRTYADFIRLKRLLDPRGILNPGKVVV